MEHINKIIQEQKIFFSTGSTLSIDYRKKQLQKLYNTLKEHESEVMLALKKDLNKSDFESYITEIGLVYEEIKFMLKNIAKFSKPQKVSTSIINFPAKSYIYQEPYGRVLIISPWNYPFQLAMIPLIGAIAAGNCAILKPASASAATTAIIAKILSTFEQKYIAVVEGGRHVIQNLLEHKFDHIFFTGGLVVGKLIMEKAARHLTPITLELGGKSPCIVDETANIELSAKRIAWGKLLNSGQTCVAPDYLLVHEQVKDALIASIKKYIYQFYGVQPEKNIAYPKIINQKHFDRLNELIQQEDDIWGGQTNIATLQIAPALLLNAHWESAAMQEEIFGPILPILTYSNLDEIINAINQRPKPLALYFFTTSMDNEQKILKHISFGGGCINDTMVHLANNNLPFGGVGESGMGFYHGKKTFEVFSHSKSILKKGLWFDSFLRYAPYKNHLSILKKIF